MWGAVTDSTHEDERRSRRAIYLDSRGAVVHDPSEAVAGTIVDDAPPGSGRRVGWFGFREIELSWLPVRESAFLLWVLVLLAVVWAVIGVVLRFS